MKTGWIRRELKIFWWRILLPTTIFLGGTAYLISLLFWDGPDRLRPLIPAGIQTGQAVYYNSEWFHPRYGSCVVAVFALEAEFAERLRREGAGALVNPESLRPDLDERGSETRGYSAWQGGPVAMSDTDMTERNISLAAGCMRSSVEYSRIYAKYAHGERGFYSKHTSGTIAIIAPVEGLLFLAPEP